MLIAFLVPYMFQRLGKDLLDIDLSYLSAMGWFTLANLLVNEIRSILENLIACGYRVPDVLKRGLEITEKVINEKKK